MNVPLPLPAPFSSVDHNYILPRCVDTCVSSRDEAPMTFFENWFTLLPRRTDAHESSCAGTHHFAVSGATRFLRQQSMPWDPRRPLTVPRRRRGRSRLARPNEATSNPQSLSRLGGRRRSTRIPKCLDRRPTIMPSGAMSAPLFLAFGSAPLSIRVMTMAGSIVCIAARRKAVPASLASLASIPFIAIQARRLSWGTALQNAAGGDGTARFHACIRRSRHPLPNL